MKVAHIFAAAALVVAASPAQSLTTTMTSNAGSSSFWASPSVSFDLDITNPAGIVIDSIEVNTPYVGITGSLEFYTTDVGGSAVGNEVTPLPGTWLLRATGSVTTAGTNTPVLVPLSKPIYLAPGTYGCYVTHRGCGVRYTNGAQLVYGNADLTFTANAAQATAFTSTLNQPRIANITFNYSAPSDTVDFTADATSGPSPLTVAFTDRSGITSGAALAYEWDFDGDGQVDSVQQNPTHTYTACGDYSPTLRVITINGPVERSWPNMIAVDPLVADFTATPESGLPASSVGFTDTSIGATGWLWDFDGDGTVDSVQQNPNWTPRVGSFATTLTVTNGCRQATITKRIDATTDSFSTNYTAANNLIAKQGLAFVDLTVTAGEALVLSGLDVNTIVHRDQTCPIKIWMTEGSGNGKQTDATAWREVANGSGISPGGNRPTRVLLDRPILLLPGRTYGLAINYLDCQPYYTSPGNASLSHPDFQLDFFGVATATTPFTSNPGTRQFNGTFYYSKATQWPVAAITPYAFGCAGSLGVPQIVPVGTTRPQLGTSWSVDVTNLPIGAGAMILGVSNSNSGFGPLPFDMSVIGMTGCTLHTSIDVTSPLSSATNTATFGLAFPANPALAGAQLYLQAISLDPFINTLSATMSDAVALLGSLD